MPQMMPLNWLTLFIMFSLTFTMYNIISYYNFNYSTFNTNFTHVTPNPMNWKW
nr:ATP synthase F0 subunit 8 [Anaplecta sp. 3 ZQW-2020]